MKIEEDIVGVFEIVFITRNQKERKNIKVYLSLWRLLYHGSVSTTYLGLKVITAWHIKPSSSQISLYYIIKIMKSKYEEI